ncbi:hypothetical protein L917_08478 [Phytophthora nicotianae]|uniref:Uncharacterized protein n=1 Tax=Phytophthora nicotianae TaxID=4792 RepID=W2L7M3_PHYNI|nr:hypothetical protein L915_08647 [Phytophthora nicotianae]ETL93352.1 hypothetical protein L917_08478 [Phytophthora nicotianae]
MSSSIYLPDMRRKTLIESSVAWRSQTNAFWNA